MIVLCLSIRWGDTLSILMVKYHLCNIDIHLITILNIPMPKILVGILNAKCHHVTLMVKLLIISIT